MAGGSEGGVDGRAHIVEMRKCLYCTFNVNVNIIHLLSLLRSEKNDLSTLWGALHEWNILACGHQCGTSFHVLLDITTSSFATLHHRHYMF